MSDRGATAIHTMRNLLLTVATFLLATRTTSGQTLVDFNTPGDFGSSTATSTHFAFSASPWYAETNAIGVGGSRGLQLQASGSDASMTYKLGGGFDFTNVGASFASSLFFYKAPATTSSSSRVLDLGLVAGPAAALSSSALGMVRLRSTGTNDVSLRFYSNLVDVGTAQSTSLVSGRFYKLSFSATNLDTADVQYTASVDDYGVSGTSLVTAGLLNLGGTYVNYNMTNARTVHAGFRTRNENTSNAIARLDNFAFSTNPGTPPPSRSFSHPGLLNSAGEIAHFSQRAGSGQGLWAQGYQRIIGGTNDAGESFLNHTPKPASQYTAAVHWSQPGVARNLLDDARAAYANVLAYQVNRNPAHAAKARQILNAWSSTLNTVVNSSNQPISSSDPRQDYMLYTSYSWPAMIWTAESLRADPSSGWTPADDQAFAQLLQNVVRPAAEHPSNTLANNWASWRIAYRMADAIYTNDTTRFNQAVAEYRAQVDAYIGANLQGEMQRDLWHSQMGLAPLLLTAEMALKQGVDLYSHRNNRLLRAIEYQIPFNLGDFTNWPFSTAPDPGVQSDGSTLWNMYEMAYNHYHNRLGILTPNLETMLAQTNVKPIPSFGTARAYRAEDFFRTGYGTLTHAGDPVRFAVLQGFDLDQALVNITTQGAGTAVRVTDPTPGQPLNGVLRLQSDAGIFSASQVVDLEELVSVWFDWRLTEGGSVDLLLDGKVLATLEAPVSGAGLHTLAQFRIDFSLADLGLVPSTYELQWRLGSGDTLWLDNLIVTTAAVPEPATVLLAVGSAWPLLSRRRTNGRPRA